MKCVRFCSESHLGAALALKNGREWIRRTRGLPQARCAKLSSTLSADLTLLQYCRKLHQNLCSMLLQVHKLGKR